MTLVTLDPICVILNEKTHAVSDYPICTISASTYLNYQIDNDDNDYAYITYKAPDNHTENKTIRYHIPSNKHVKKWIDDILHQSNNLTC